MDTIDKIIELMDEHRITDARLTRDANLSNGLVGQWKQRKQKPSYDSIMKIADYFNVSTDYLLGKTDIKNPPGKNPEDVTFDDFTYAMHNEIKELTEDEKQQLLDLAKIMRQRRLNKEKSAGNGRDKRL